MNGDRPPAVVAIGGGRGLAATLRALRDVTDDITAVVSVADDGGSTGRLRAASGGLAPGDLRKCLVALSPDSVLAEAMEHRFEGGELAGHPLGNLLLAGLDEQVGMVDALAEMARVLGTVGRVVPVTLDAVTLVGTTLNGEIRRGQTRLLATPDIDVVALEPRVAATPDAITAIRRADLVVVGPGSLYTSVLAALVTPGVVGAITDSRATAVYVANLCPQEAETRGYSTADHVDALARHGFVPDLVVDEPALADASGAVHDPERLAKRIAEITRI